MVIGIIILSKADIIISPDDMQRLKRLYVSERLKYTYFRQLPLLSEILKLFFPQKEQLFMIYVSL